MNLEEEAFKELMKKDKFISYFFKAIKDKTEELLKGHPRSYNLARKIDILYRCMYDSYRLKKDLSKYSSWKIVLGASGVLNESWIPTDITCFITSMLLSYSCATTSTSPSFYHFQT